MAGQPKSIVRRLSQVFVEIPSSALHKSNNNSIPTTSSATHAVSSRKQNPLRASISQNTIINKSSKRKADESNDKPLKKPKLETVAIKLNTTRRPLANATPDFPNGFLYCHQCNKKRDAALAVQCTRADAKSNRRCISKYCGPCLKNRYGLSLQDVLSTSTVPAAEKKHHVSGEGYFFKCPRCEETCNCVHCRKAKGLQPTGNLTFAARKSGLQSAAELLLQDPTAAGPMSGKPVAEKKMRTTKSAPQPTTSAISKSKSRSTKNLAHIHTPAPLPAPKPLPKALWTPVRTHLSLHGAEARIYIREFALRFLPLSRSHHDELEFLSRSRRDFDEEEDEDGDLEPWISEGCVKALLIALLGMIEVDSEVLSTTASALHQQSFLFKIVNTLSTLGTLPSLALPSPTPAPEHLLQSVPTIRTRSARMLSHHQNANGKSKETDWPEVVRTSQLIPVVSVLVDHATQGQAVRDAIEEGAKDVKELTRESIEVKRALDRAEKERKEKEKAEKEQKAKDAKGQGKDKKAKGKAGATAKEKDAGAKDLEAEPTHTLTPQTALTLALSSCAQRIAPLGRDSEGRVYWALMPGRGERDYAREYLASNIEVGELAEGAATKSHKAKSRSPWTPPSLPERASHKRWSWFVAVWGVRPGVEERIDPPKDEDYSEDESESELDSGSGEDEDEDNGKKPRKMKTERPRWYAFSDPAEIFKLAEWVEGKAGLKSRSSSSEKSKPQPVTALPSRTASSSTSHVVSSSNTHTSASISRAASSFNSLPSKLSKASKFASSHLADVQMVSSFETDESEFSDEDQSEDGGDKRDDDMDVDSHMDFDDTPQLQSLVRELRTYAALLKKRA
ncbi:zinc-finger domain of monoamine-oxidase A repressor R1-domain-containing protein [Suillus clintonianus]|uniref:zinc-finger domain of monoamine-oxidase A repressor R1-domain-containing protein n=1 Tax=Suillus clintonianus TaxID=1904413 RepID=UPI001B88570B|nr:zinc-finger domain of monoamine-oxidase A repressor R1-domain-containing protein [Suillus clintonianus]KAG2150574.1 zinc-finger domain of monoamine-oxidase A repressor R1-domain-containing protein [Suillus clintonianus]